MENKISYFRSLFSNEKVCKKILQMMSLLSNKTRLRIVCFLTEGEAPVNEIVEAVGGKISNISQQLKMLHMAGYLESRREEKNIYYSLVDTKIKDMIMFLHDRFI